MTKLYLTRHGETEWNLEGRLQGHLDSPLTLKGESQAAWLGARMKDTSIDIIIASSSNRAKRTAELVRGNRDIEIVTSDHLKEINLGKWEGMLHKEIEQNYAEAHRNFRSAPHLYQPVGGETFQEVIDRVSREIERLKDKYNGKTLLIVTHGVVLKALWVYFGKKEICDLWSGNFMYSTCLNLVEYKDNEWQIIIQGDTSHYQ